MEILAQFLFRLTFGLAVGMGITSYRQVASGFFRNHLYVMLGLGTLTALLANAAAPEAFWYAVGVAVASYVGSVCWLYEEPVGGNSMLWVVAIVSLMGSQSLGDRFFDSIDDHRYFVATQGELTDAGLSRARERAMRVYLMSGALFQAANISSGLLLGTTMAAMFLGHWYLNSPTMQLAPLRRLLLAMGVALILQGLLSISGLAFELHYATQFSRQLLLFVLLRWSFGLCGVAVLTWMAWRTLEIPNTQSATGILYVAVIGVFVGELAAALLSAESAFPL